MNIRYVAIIDLAHVGFKNYFALFTFVGTVHEWGQFYQLFKSENYLKQKTILKQPFWTQIFPHQSFSALQQQQHPRAIGLTPGEVIPSVTSWMNCLWKKQVWKWKYHRISFQNKELQWLHRWQRLHGFFFSISAVQKEWDLLLLFVNQSNPKISLSCIPQKCKSRVLSVAWKVCVLFGDAVPWRHSGSGSIFSWRKKKTIPACAPWSCTSWTAQAPSLI